MLHHDGSMDFSITVGCACAPSGNRCASAPYTNCSFPWLATGFKKDFSRISVAGRRQFAYLYAAVCRIRERRRRRLCEVAEFLYTPRLQHAALVLAAGDNEDKCRQAWPRSPGCSSAKVTRT